MASMAAILGLLFPMATWVAELAMFCQGKQVDEHGFNGCHFGVIVPHGYMSGGAGYVLSR